MSDEEDGVVVDQGGPVLLSTAPLPEWKRTIRPVTKGKGVWRSEEDVSRRMILINMLVFNATNDG